MLIDESRIFAPTQIIKRTLSPQEIIIPSLAESGMELIFLLRIFLQI